MKCDHCPVGDLACPGERVTGLCRWVDPASLGYHRNGAETLVRLAEGRSMEPAPRQLPGPGDAVAIVARRSGITRVVAWWARVTGRPCNCEERRAALNRAGWRPWRWLTLR
jgi:hypothetical protein